MQLLISTFTQNLDVNSKMTVTSPWNYVNSIWSISELIVTAQSASRKKKKFDISPISAAYPNKALLIAIGETVTELSFSEILKSYVL